MRQLNAAGISMEQDTAEYPNDARPAIRHALALGFLAGTGLTLMVGLLVLPLSGSASLVESARSGAPSAEQARGQVETPAFHAFAALVGHTSIGQDAELQSGCRAADLPYEMTMGDSRQPCR